MDHRLRANRAAWTEMAKLHVRGSSTYPVRKLLAGKPGWAAPLPDDLGPVRGKSILHLQCHFGMDTLWWAKRGARVTGVDFSPFAVAKARELSRRTGIPARFIESNVYDLPRVLTGRFDMVLSYCGTICWLPDLARWAKVVARFLKPGGLFYIAEGHPLAGTLEFDGPGGAPRLTRSYFPGRPERYVDTGGTYAMPHAKTRRRICYEWQHSLAEIVGAVRGAGLTLEALHEFPYAFFDVTFTNGRLMRKDRSGFWHLKGARGRWPLMFSLKARHGTGR